jgi:hypothetical protein
MFSLPRHGIFPTAVFLSGKIFQGCSAEVDDAKMMHKGRIVGELTAVFTIRQST